MAKKVKKSDFEYIQACIDPDGDLTFYWKLFKASQSSSLRHDDSVEGWRDHEVAKLAKEMVGADEDDPIEVEVIWE